MERKFPDGYQEMFCAAFGQQAWDEYARAMTLPPTRGLRLNPMKGMKRAIASHQHIPWTANGYFIDQDDRIGNDPLHAAGCVYLQEPTAMAPVSALLPQPGERVLDLCAAPGGKTTQMGAMMQNTGFLLANDPHPTRCEALVENVERMGLAHTAVTNVQPQQLTHAYPGFFDAILVDAPCSGEGLFRREPEAMAFWSPQLLIDNARRQLEILECAYQMLQPGGRLVYSTCTFNPVENEFVCAAFLDKHADMQLQPLRPPCSDTALSPEQLLHASQEFPALQALLATLSAEWTHIATNHAARFFPQHSAGEGHFIASFIHTRPASAAPSSRREAIARTNVADRAEGLVSKHASSKKRHEQETADHRLVLEAFRAFASDTLHPRFLDDLQRHRRLIARGNILYAIADGAERMHTMFRPGLPLLRLEHKHAVPAHALALAMRRGDALHEWRMAYNDPRVLDYLAGQPLAADRPNGWHWITVDGAPLGWGKVANGTLKNHFPKGLRRRYEFSREPADDKDISVT